VACASAASQPDNDNDRSISSGDVCPSSLYHHWILVKVSGGGYGKSRSRRQMAPCKAWGCRFVFVAVHQHRPNLEADLGKQFPYWESEPSTNADTVRRIFQNIKSCPQNMHHRRGTTSNLRSFGSPNSSSFPRHPNPRLPHEAVRRV
jgi:hypothetical protein